MDDACLYRGQRKGEMVIVYEYSFGRGEFMCTKEELDVLQALIEANNSKDYNRMEELEQLLMLKLLLVVVPE